MFKSLRLFEFIFVHCMRMVLTALIYIRCSTFPTPLAEEIVFFPFYILTFVIEDWLAINVWVYFWTLCFIDPFVCLGIIDTVLITVQFSSVAQLCPTLCDPMNQAREASLSVTNSRSSPKPMSIESVMPSSHSILCCPLLLLPPIIPSIRVFSSESTFRMRWAKYWSFSFSISPSNERPGLISFRMDWLDLLAVQGTLKSLLQHHSSETSILWHSAFFTIQLSHPYMTTGKTIAWLDGPLLAE